MFSSLVLFLKKIKFALNAKSMANRHSQNIKQSTTTNEPDSKPSTSPKTTKSSELTEFLDINGDCIFANCEMLDLFGIKSMNLTCLRLYRLTSERFNRKYTDKRIEVGCQRKQSLHFKITGEHQKYFHFDIRNVRINGRNVPMYNIFKLIKANVFVNLKHLELGNFRGNISEKYGKTIEDHLKQRVIFMRSIEIL